MYRPETIFALSSGGGRAGVAVIRLSGPTVREVVARIAGALPPARQAVLRRLREPASGEMIDTGLVLFFPGPDSFTGEDVAEFQVHGSRAVIQRLLAVLGRQPGCGLAEGGEFARRALLNGKLDLLDIEALGDLIAADTEVQRKMALRGGGELRGIAAGWRDRMIDLRARVEAEIDFADEGDVTARLDSDTERESLELAAELEALANSAGLGERLRDGLRVAILGPPNAGKSSLLNALAKRDVAIVHDLPGTTRDVIEVMLEIDGLPVIVMDVAGIRETDDAVEREGVSRAWKAAELADLVLWANPVDSPAECPDPRFVEVKTKVDLKPVQSGLTVSVRTEGGLAGLMDLLRQRASESFSGLGTAAILRSERQAEALRRGARALRMAAQHAPTSLDLRAEELRQACDRLDEFVGRIGPEQVLDEIFARFCVGK